MLVAGALLAEVPNRLTYQGRLAKRGVSLSGDHIFVARILDQDGKALWSSGNITQKLPITGDFALVLEPTGIDWLNVKPSLEISIDGEKFTPNEPFAASPYANAAAIAATVPDGVITNAKLASNLSLSPEKVGITGSTTLNDWRSTEEGFTHKINSDMIRGNITSDYTQVSGTAVVCTANRMQVIKPEANVVPLVVASLYGGTTNAFEVRGANGNLALAVSKDGNVGIGQISPDELLVVNGRIKDVGGYVAIPGQIVMYGGSSAPAGWLMCDGSAVSRTTYADLFAIVGTSFGTGDGSSTFNVPNFQRKVPVGAGGSGTGMLGNAVGNSGGEENHTLTVGEMPSHQHAKDPIVAWFMGAVASGGAQFASGPGSQYDTFQNTANAGGSGAHNNLPPSLVVNYIIKF